LSLASQGFDIRAEAMPTKHVRPTPLGFHVLVVSERLHGQRPRTCDACGASWTVVFTEGRPRVQKNGDEAQDAILDWAGNNVAVECCRAVGSSNRDAADSEAVAPPRSRPRPARKRGGLKRTKAAKKLRGGGSGG
jgi:hypothetical protein